MMRPSDRATFPPSRERALHGVARERQVRICPVEALVNVIGHGHRMVNDGGAPFSEREAPLDRNLGDAADVWCSKRHGARLGIDEPATVGAEQPKVQRYRVGVFEQLRHRVALGNQ